MYRWVSRLIVASLTELNKMCSLIAWDSFLGIFTKELHILWRWKNLRLKLKSRTALLNILTGLWEVIVK